MRFLSGTPLHVAAGCEQIMTMKFLMSMLTVRAIILHTAYGTPPAPAAVSGMDMTMPWISATLRVLQFSTGPPVRMVR